MEVILLEKHQKLGDIGNIAVVKDGYARNFLIPTKKAIRATAENKKVFEVQKAAIQKEFDQKKAKAESAQKHLEGKSIILVRQSGEDSRLYGSVSANDIVKAIKEQLSHDLPKSSINLVQQIKYTGVYHVQVNIFADVRVEIKLAVARNEAEAEDELKNELANKLKKEAEAFEASHPVTEEPADPFKDPTESETEAEIEEVEENSDESED